MSFIGNYKFTNRKHPMKGGMSLILGMIAMFSSLLVVYLTYQGQGDAPARYGMVCFLCVLMAFAGFILGILGKIERDAYFFFPVLGIIVNLIVLVINGYYLYVGM